MGGGGGTGAQHIVTGALPSPELSQDLLQMSFFVKLLNVVKFQIPLIFFLLLFVKDIRYKHIINLWVFMSQTE